MKKIPHPKVIQVKSQIKKLNPLIATHIKKAEALQPYLLMVAKNKNQYIIDEKYLFAKTYSLRYKRMKAEYNFVCATRDALIEQCNMLAAKCKYLRKLQRQIENTRNNVNKGVCPQFVKSNKTLLKTLMQRMEQA
ncbi:hypothetical protein Acj133p041 [Acinetobacter phage 133]|uniref:Uncharacterized protein n=1 Tax=Acinetobacter phage 133 TaxID=2919552 RepID=D9I607_9CAUD|nr:hypothetical protein Acj133p041 [Acinetobacter phage 133]ADJ19388.1 hypothetical protein Acj133p041 [Acinetobacter phage 133]